MIHQHEKILGLTRVTTLQCSRYCCCAIKSWQIQETMSSRGLRLTAREFSESVNQTSEVHCWIFCENRFPIFSRSNNSRFELDEINLNDMWWHKKPFTSLRVHRKQSCYWHTSRLFSRLICLEWKISIESVFRQKGVMNLSLFAIISNLWCVILRLVQ